MSWKAHGTPLRAAGSWWGGRAVAPGAQASLAGGPKPTPVCTWKLSTAEVLPGQRGLWKARQIIIWPSLSFSICNLGESPPHRRRMTRAREAFVRERGKIP